MMKFTVLTLMSLALSFLTVGEAQAAKFTFTKIADTKGLFSDFGSFSLNNTGTLAFNGRLDTGETGIFTSNGTTTTPIVTSKGDASILFSRPDINDAGTVVYLTRQNNTSTVLTSNGVTTNTVATIPEANIPEQELFEPQFSTPSINNAGTVAFSRNKLNLSNSRFQGSINIVTSDGRTSVVTDPGTFLYVKNPVINDAGNLAYETLSVDRRGGQIILLNNQQRQEIFGGRFSNLLFQLNNKGTIAYSVLGPGGKFTGTLDGNKRTSIINTDGDINVTDSGINPGFGGFSEITINDNGTVAVTGTTQAGKLGIFVGTKPSSNDLIIAEGDSLFGSTITGLNFYRKALNNSGQLAFNASFSDGTSGIFLANLVTIPPKNVPEPVSTLGILAFAVFGLGVIHKGLPQKL